MVKEPNQKKTTRRAKFQLKQQREMAKFKALQAKLKALQEALQAIEYQEHCDVLDSLHAIQLQKLRDEFALAKKLTN